MVDEKQNVVSVKFLTMEDPDFVEEEEAVMFVSKCTVMMCNKMLGQKWLFDGSKKAMEQSWGANSVFSKVAVVVMN